jgi:hypothetical protein
MQGPGRSDPKLEELVELSEQVTRRPTVKGFVGVIIRMTLRPLRTPAGMILASAIVLLMVWGHDGELPLLHQLWSGWRPSTDPTGRPSVIPGLAWDQEWVSFAAGVVLLVLVPCFLIKVVFRHRLRDYGLGLPERNRMKLSAFSAAFLLLASLPFFLLSTGDEGMQATYPLYRGELNGVDFVVYELGYFLFFVVIEFVFRGYLLLGLFDVKDREALPEGSGERGPLMFGYYAIFISMLSYTAWHLGKPTPELWGTIVWGPLAGGVVLLTRSIWPVVAAHWLLNVLLDLILK